MYKIIIFLFPCCLFSSFFEENISMAKPGDFVIYEQGKSASMLIINQIDNEKLVLEEICFPSYLKNKIRNPKKWVDTHAKGHTSWRIYELDRNDFSLIEAYSYKDSGHLLLNKQNFFLSKLLTLHLQKIPHSKRRKVGSLEDRKAWNPPIITGGERQKPECDAYVGKWEKDGSELSEKKIEVYFSKDHSFFFPYWLEVEAAKTSFSIRVIDCGNHPFNKKSPPKRRPYFVRKPVVQKKSVELNLQIPKYYQEFTLEALDLTKPELPPVILTPSLNIDHENVHIIVDSKSFENNHPYRIILTPKNHPNIKTDTTFLFDK